MKILFLDDESYRFLALATLLPDTELIRAYTADEAIALLKDDPVAPYDVIFLDHDLSIADQNSPNPKEKTGLVVARHMTTLTWRCPVIVHSLNPVGAKAMVAALSASGWYAIHRPGAWARCQLQGSLLCFD